MVGSCELDDEHCGSGVTELVSEANINEIQLGQVWVYHCVANMNEIQPQYWQATQ